MKKRSSLLRASIFAVLCTAALSAAAQGVTARLPVAELGAGMYRIEAEVAATPDHRMVGLMNRRSMPANHGMLFVFTERRAHCMWMKNTLIPLSVAFLDAEGRVLNIADMQPQTEDIHCAQTDVRYALEAPLHWFARRGIRPGSSVLGLPGAR